MIFILVLIYLIFISFPLSALYLQPINMLKSLITLKEKKKKKVLDDLPLANVLDLHLMDTCMSPVFSTYGISYFPSQYFKNIPIQVEFNSHLIHPDTAKPKRYFNLYITGVLSCIRHWWPQILFKKFYFPSLS